MRFLTSLCLTVSIWCAILLLPLVVLAADAAVAGVPAEHNPWWHMVLVDVLLGVGAVAIGLLGRALTMLFDWLAAKTGITCLALVDDLVMDEVVALYNKEVEHAKKASADGKLSKTEKERFASIATTHAKGLLSLATLKKLIELLGSEDKVNEMISAKVEKAVTVSKNAGKMARGGAIAKALGAASDPPGPSASSR